MPKRIMFPATRLLAGLQSRERTPARSPWWLTALRILIITLAVLALAGPVLNPPGAQTVGSSPLLLVVDNGWSAASRWETRQAAMDNALDAAQRNGQTVILAPTATLTQSWSATPATPAETRERAASLEPMPYAPERDLLASRLGESLPPDQQFDVLWLSDGVDHPGTEALATLLREVADSLTVISDPPDRARSRSTAQPGRTAPYAHGSCVRAARRSRGRSMRCPRAATGWPKQILASILGRPRRKPCSICRWSCATMSRNCALPGKTPPARCI